MKGFGQIVLPPVFLESRSSKPLPNQLANYPSIPLFHSRTPAEWGGDRMNGCRAVSRLCLNSACILRRLHSKAVCITVTCQGCPISKAPSNAVDKCSLLFLDLKDPPAASFTAQHIPRFIARRIFSEIASERGEVAVAANDIFNDKTL